MRRKLFIYVLSFFSGILAYVTFKAGVVLFIPVFLYGKSQTIVMDMGGNNKRIYIIILCFFLGALHCLLADSSFNKVSRLVSREPVTVYFQVDEVVKFQRDKTVLDCSILNTGNKNTGKYITPRVRIYCYQQGALAPSNLPGALCSGKMRLSIPDPAGNPRGFDMNMYLRGRGVGLVATCSNVKILRRSGSPVHRISGFLLQKRRDYLDHLPEDDLVTGTIAGILFGDTSSMDEDLLQDFRNNGTSHVLAVSGLHVGLLYKFLQFLLGRRSFGKFATVVILLCYGTISLWAVSVTRAVALILLSMAAEGLERRYDLLTSLSLVAFVIALRHPYSIFLAGTQMSFLAVASMAFLTPVIERGIRGNLAHLLAVQLGTLPYMAYTFNTLPLLSIIANIPVIYLLSLTVPLGLVDFLLFAVREQSTAITDILCAQVRGLSAMNTLISNDGVFALNIISPPVSLVLGMYVLVFFLCSETGRVWRIRRNPALRTVAALVLVCAVAGVPLGRTGFENASVIMVDVGQGDAIHFRYDTNGALPGGKKDVLIDGGGQEEFNVGKNVLRPYFLKNGEGHVELAYATHLHTDHYKGLVELEEEGLVDRLVTEGRAGDVIWFGKEKDKDNCIEIIYPDVRDPDTDDENKNSLIFKVHIEGITCLVTGDLGEEGERALVEKYKGTDVLDCDILKVCHHGSRYSSCREFLEAVSPRIALIGVGKRNTYGHPAEEVIKRLEEVGAKVYRTDKDGAIGINIESGRLSVICAKYICFLLCCVKL